MPLADWSDLENELNMLYSMSKNIMCVNTFFNIVKIFLVAEKNIS